LIEANLLEVAMVELKKITLFSDNLKECIDLDVAPEKDDFINSNAVMLAITYEYNAKGIASESRAIYAGDKMVGLISYNYYTEDPVFKEVCYRIRPIMIDKNHQGKEYENAALQKLLEEIRTKPHGEASAVFATYDPEEEDMAKLYESFGFIKTDMNWDAENPNDNDVIVRMAL
jgi:diamine N-acetyltransferase